MPYDSSGVFTRASNTTPTAGTAITVSLHETEWEDLKTSMNKLPVKDVANTFTASQTVTSTDSGALSTSLYFTMYRNSSSPSAADGLAVINFNGNNASGTEKTYGAIVGLISDSTAGSEDGVVSIRTISAGSTVVAMNFATGMYYQGGVDLGAGVVNATHLGITDGVTAPSATVGYAKIYVDSSGGDLKVIFGDGTVKTIVVDT